MVSSVSGASTASNSLRITGLASGMDTEQMVSDLMKAARIPRDQVYQKQQWVQWQQGAYRDINLAMDTFRKAEENLRFQSTFNAYSATSSNPAAATATATGNAVQGSYSVNVTQTAQVATFISANPVLDSTGAQATSSAKVLPAGQTASITVTNASGNTATIAIDDTFTFKSLADAITNAADSNNTSLGLRASFDDTTHSFVISTKDTGSTNGFTISNTLDGSGNPMGNVADVMNGGVIGSSSGGTTNTISRSGLDAKVDITVSSTSNGTTSSTTTSITQATNNISALGLNITAISAGSTTVSVKTDTDGVYNNIKGFVDAYNTLIDTINTKVNEKRNRDYPPLTEEQRSSMTDKQIELWEEKAKSGLLSHDSTLQDIADRLRNSINTPVQSIANSSIRTLSSIGIGTEFLKSDGTIAMDYDNSGKLKIDETKLRDAIANHPDDVMNLFTKADPQADYTVTPPVKARTDYEGIGSRLYDIANESISQLNDRAGIPNMSTADTSALGQQLKDFADQLSRWDDRLSLLQDRYNKEFTAMESAINKFNAQGGYLSQSLG